MSTFTVCKYEGLGNDFLVLHDPDRSHPYDKETVARLCDRHRGVGADGFIRLSKAIGNAASRMELRNADGSFAETSGNGLRCAALATRLLGICDDKAFDIETEVSTAHVEFERPPVFGAAIIRVSMGRLHLAKVDSPIPGRIAYRVDVGNPHLVLIGENVSDVDLQTVGPQLEAGEPEGLNVEVIAPGRESDSIDLVVWERGAGLTEACGSGSCAAAAAALAEALVTSHVLVHNPGGDLVVELSGDEANAHDAVLVGPARRIATVQIDVDELMGMAMPSEVHA